VFEKNKLVLMEAAIVEQLRRTKGVDLHPELVHAPLIYDETGRKELSRLYKNYIEIALNAGVPFLMFTPTWRTNLERVSKSQIDKNINLDAVNFLKEIRNSYSSTDANIQIGGMIGCKNDCYKPEEGLSVAEAVKFHTWQIKQFAEAGVDFLIAETLPNIEEATGIALAMEKFQIPYIISFVIDRHGRLLDGTSLMEAVDRIDSTTHIEPLGYTVNCAYPTFLCAEKQPENLFKRLIGYQANASSLDHCDLDGSEDLKIEEIGDWGKEMLALNKTHGLKMLGGCCGTGVKHLRYLVENYTAVSPGGADKQPCDGPL